MAFVIVETTYETPLTDRLRDDVEKQLEPCMQLRGVRWRHSYEANDRRRKICVFEAPDAGSVRDAFRSARIPFDRMWAAEFREPVEEADDSGHRVRVSRTTL